MKKAMILLFAALAMLASSCGSYKRLAYLQDMEPGIDYSMPLQPDAIIAKGDRLSINVVCSTPELAAPFNILNGTAMATAQITGNGFNSQNNQLSTEGGTNAESNEGYEVDNKGDLTFPVLGKIHVEGMTLKQVKERIESQIVSRRYIKDPIVVVKFTNFKFTILGEGSPGIYSVPDGRINIFDALAMSGDVSQDAVRRDIRVVRTVDGKRRMYNIDLTTKDCYYSPVFFIQQNDMIYIMPKNAKFDSTVNNRFTIFNSIITGLSTIVNALIWSTYLSK